MNVMRIVALAGLWLIVSACAGTGSNGGQAAAPVSSAAVAPAGDAQASAEVSELREVAVTAAAATESPDDVICRREVRTGSHFATRVCRTRAEIEATQRDTQEFMRERQRAAGGAGASEVVTP